MIRFVILPFYDGFRASCWSCPCPHSFTINNRDHFASSSAPTRNRTPRSGVMVSPRAAFDPAPRTLGSGHEIVVSPSRQLTDLNLQEPSSSSSSSSTRAAPGGRRVGMDASARYSSDARYAVERFTPADSDQQLMRVTLNPPAQPKANLGNGSRASSSSFATGINLPPDPGLPKTPVDRYGLPRDRDGSPASDVVDNITLTSVIPPPLSPASDHHRAQAAQQQPGQLSREESEQRLTQIEHARLVAAGTIAYCGFFALLALIVGISDGSVALIGLAVEFTLDAITSALVLWRFKRGKSRSFTSRYAEADFTAKRDRMRERNSGIGIGICFLTSALFLLIMAFWKTVSWDNRGKHGQENRETSFYSEAIAWPCCIVFSVLAAVKRQLSIDLGSAVLYEDAVSSFLGAILSGVVIVAGFLERLHVPGAWRADAVAGIFIAAALGYEGQRSLRHNLDGSAEEEHQMMQEF